MLIPYYNLFRLQVAIEAMNRRCRKLNQPEIRLIIGETVFEERRHATGVKYQFKVVDVAVVGKTPILDSWKLVGIVEEYLQAENMVRCVPGETVPIEYRFADKHCDHCKLQRKRKEVFVLRHIDGRYVQVGRQCLADFLGHKSVEAMVAQAEWEMKANSELQDACEEYYGRVEKTIPLDLFVSTTAIVIRRMGWVSHKMAEEATLPTMTTATFVWQILASDDKFTRELIESNQLYAETRDEELAAKAIAWAASLPTNGSNYEFNLGVACRCASVTYRMKGVVASVIVAYNNERVVKSESSHVHVGTVGKREEFAVTVKKLNYFDSQYGVKTLVHFEDAGGNTLIWWASGNTDWLAAGDELTIIGTVTKHDNYKGTLQTVLKRVRKA